MKADRITRKLKAGNRWSARQNIIYHAESAGARVHAHELDSVIRFRVSRRWTGDQHYAFSDDSVLAHPPRSPLAPVVRFVCEMDGMHAIRECEILTRSSI